MRPAPGNLVGVRAALLATAATIVVIVLPAPAVARDPSAKQVSSAVSRAERSSSLWATINICASDGTGRGGQLGVRGQMPALGFASTLRMTVALRYWSRKHERFEPIGGAEATSNLLLGAASSGRQQDGMLYRFRGSTGLLDASIDFTWTRRGRVIAQADRVATAGHPDADYGRPAHYSAAHCLLG